MSRFGTRYQVECAGCGVSFTAFRSDTRFCAHNCRVLKWSAENKEKRLTHKRKYDTSEHGSAKRAAWRSVNPGRLKELAKIFYMANRERRITYATARNKAKPECHRAASRAYQKTERGRQMSLESRWRRIAAQKAAPGLGVTIAQFHEVCDEFENHCLCCLRKFDKSELTMDHVQPISKGGAHDIDNIQPMCLPCNQLKKTKTLDYRPAFWWRGPSMGLENYIAAKQPCSTLAA